MGTWTRSISRSGIPEPRFRTRSLGFGWFRAKRWVKDGKRLEATVRPEQPELVGGGLLIELMKKSIGTAWVDRTHGEVKVLKLHLIGSLSRRIPTGPWAATLPWRSWSPPSVQPRSGTGPASSCAPGVVGGAFACRYTGDFVRHGIRGMPDPEGNATAIVGLVSRRAKEIFETTPLLFGALECGGEGVY